MASWIEKHWGAVAAGVALGAVGLYLLEKKAAATTAITTAANSNMVMLQPGSTTIAPAVGSTVTLTLPANASWTNVTDTAGVIQATYSAFNSPVSFIAATADTVTATWNDGTGAIQTTTINVAPH